MLWIRKAMDQDLDENINSRLGSRAVVHCCGEYAVVSE